MRAHGLRYEHALRALDRLATDRARSRDPRLPTIRQLATQTGVSPMTMSKAVRVLARRGVLIVKHGAGIRVTGHTAPETSRFPVPQPVRPKWRRMCMLLQQDIADRRLAPDGCLPNAKELGRRYGVSQATLRKALDNLQLAGMLVPVQRGFRLTSFLPAAGADTLALYTIGDEFGRMTLYGARGSELVRALETERLSRGLTVAVSTFHYVGGVGFRAMGWRRQKTAGRALGYLMRAPGVPGDKIEEVVAEAVRAGRPVAVLDELGELRLRRALLEHRLVRVFAVAYTPRAGIDVGRFLVEQGHRRVVFISAYHDEQYSRNRLTGLVSAFELVGLPDAVVAITSAPADRPRPWTVDQRAFGTAYRAFARALTRKSSESARAVMPSPSSTGEQMMSLAVRSEAQAGEVRRLCEEAVRVSGATAIVGVNDDTAIEVMRFVRERGIEPGGGLSVVGFDDRPEAFVHSLTSYNFDCQGIIRAMVGHVLAPSLQPSGDPGVPREIPGYLTVRSSTSPVRAGG